MTNDNDNLAHLTNAHLENKLMTSVMPGTLREAKTLLTLPEDLELRLLVSAEAHTAANMAGGRYNDHLESIARLAVNDPEAYKVKTKAFLKEVHSNRYRF